MKWTTLFAFFASCDVVAFGSASAGARLASVRRKNLASNESPQASSWSIGEVAESDVQKLGDELHKLISPNLGELETLRTSLAKATGALAKASEEDVEADDDDAANHQGKLETLRTSLAKDTGAHAKAAETDVEDDDDDAANLFDDGVGATSGQDEDSETDRSASNHSQDDAPRDRIGNVTPPSITGRDAFTDAEALTANVSSHNEKPFAIEEPTLSFGLTEAHRVHNEVEQKRLEFSPLSELINKKYSLVRKEPARIAVASQCGGEFFGCEEGVFTKSFANHRAYAEKNGYEYFLLQSRLSDRLNEITLTTEIGKAAVSPWDRYPLIAHLHDRGAEWVLFVEADALFMNIDIRVVDFVQEHAFGKDLIASGDPFENYMAGNVLMRKSAWMHSTMCKAWKVCPSPKYDQMGAMMTIIGGGDPDNDQTWPFAYGQLMGNGVSNLQQMDKMQHLPEEMREHVMLLPQEAMNAYDDAYAAGDWIIHFAGKPNKADLVKKWAGRTTSFLQARPSACGKVVVPLSGWNCDAVQ